MSIRSTLLSAAVAATLLLPSLASAKDTLLLGKTLVASGFCTIASDSTRGVMLDGVTSYTQWLAFYALGEDRLKLATDQYRVSHPTAGELEIGQYAAQLKKLEALFQIGNITRGQIALCPR